MPRKDMCHLKVVSMTWKPERWRAKTIHSEEGYLFTSRSDRATKSCWMKCQLFRSPSQASSYGISKNLFYLPVATVKFAMRIWFIAAGQHRFHAILPQFRKPSQILLIVSYLEHTVKPHVICVCSTQLYPYFSSTIQQSTDWGVC